MFFLYCLDLITEKHTEQRTFPKSCHALLSRTSNEVQVKLSVACNDGSGADHLRQTELPFSRSNSPKSLTNLQCDKERLQTITEGTIISSGTHNSQSMNGTNGKCPANFVMSDNSKCPPPVFTKTQKLHVIQAWQQIHLHIEEVNI